MIARSLAVAALLAVLSWGERPNVAAEPLPDFDANNPAAKGVILGFHRWPDAREEAVLLETLAAAGLEAGEEFERFRVRVFDWPEWREAAQAAAVCEEILALALTSLEYCEPNALVGPAD